MGVTGVKGLQRTTGPSPVNANGLNKKNRELMVGCLDQASTVESRGKESIWQRGPLEEHTNR